MIMAKKFGTGSINVMKPPTKLKRLLGKLLFCVPLYIVICRELVTGT